MGVVANVRSEGMVADKAKLRRALERSMERSGQVIDRGATVARARALMLADGVRPEDNIGSREVLRMREE